MTGSICSMRAVATVGLLTKAHLTSDPSNAGQISAMSSAPRRDSDDPDRIRFVPCTERQVDTGEVGLQISGWGNEVAQAHIRTLRRFAQADLTARIGCRRRCAMRTQTNRQDS